MMLQLDGLKVAPLAVLVQVTVPVGVSGVPGDVSDTVAVHLVPEVQKTLVDVDRRVIVRLSFSALPVWSLSPA
jgi:hypothetical protein